MIKGVLFDFDGVLTTDATGSLSICKYISKAIGIDFDKIDISVLYDSFVNTPIDERMQTLAYELKENCSVRIGYESNLF